MIFCHPAAGDLEICEHHVERRSWAFQDDALSDQETSCEAVGVAVWIEEMTELATGEDLAIYDFSFRAWHDGSYTGNSGIPK